MFILQGPYPFTRVTKRVLLEKATCVRQKCLKNKPYVIPYSLKCKMRFFLKFVVLTWRHLKFAYKAPNHTVPNWIARNWTMLSQTMVCIAKLSCDISAPLRYYAVLSCDSLPTFRDYLLVPSSRVTKSKREREKVNEKLTDLGLVNHLIF